VNYLSWQKADKRFCNSNIDKLT